MMKPKVVGQSYDQKAKHNPTNKGNLTRKQIIVFVFGSIVFIGGCIAFIYHLAFPLHFQDGNSMRPTIENGRYFRVNPYVYQFQLPQRGDIVAFTSPNPNEPNIRLAKRVIGLPGEKVECRENQIYINDALLFEPYLFEPMTFCGDATWVLGDDEYFVMGDNRNHSRDSRSFGPIPITSIIGKAMLPTTSE